MREETGDEDEDEEGDDDSADDDNEDDIIDELPKVSLAAARRRISVSAEASVDPRALKAQWEAERKVYPKSDNDRRRLRAILADNLLFQRLDAEQMETVLDALSPVLVRDTKTIIKQGTAGDLFYVVESGSPEVFVEVAGRSTKVRVSRCPRSSPPSSSLLSPLVVVIVLTARAAPRAVSCRSDSRSHVCPWCRW